MSNPTELPDLDAERLLFEADTAETFAAATFGRFPVGGNYNVTWVQEQWNGWQRAIRARRAQPEGEAPQADGLTRYSMWSSPVGHGMDPSPSGDWVSFDEVRDLLADQYQGARCSTCDGTGMVHRADGEYLGECGCEDAASAPAATLSPLCGAQHADSGKGARFGSAEVEQDARDQIDAQQAAAPADCSGTPSSCPDNEGYGCHCSAPGTPEAPKGGVA